LRKWQPVGPVSVLEFRKSLILDQDSLWLSKSLNLTKLLQSVRSSQSFPTNKLISVNRKPDLDPEDVQVTGVDPDDEATADPSAAREHYVDVG